MQVIKDDLGSYRNNCDSSGHWTDYYMRLVMNAYTYYGLYTGSDVKPTLDTSGPR